MACDRGRHEVSSSNGSAGNGGITRRDFLDGVAIGAAGLAVAAASPHLTGAEAALAAGSGKGKTPPYPPTGTGMQGLHGKLIRRTMKIDGVPNPGDVHTTNGGPADATKIVPIRLYETAFRFFDLGYAAAIGLTMLAVSILLANLFMRVLKKRGLAK